MSCPVLCCSVLSCPVLCRFVSCIVSSYLVFCCWPRLVLPCVGLSCFSPMLTFSSTSDVPCLAFSCCAVLSCLCLSPLLTCAFQHHWDRLQTKAHSSWGSSTKRHPAGCCCLGMCLEACLWSLAFGVFLLSCQVA